MNESDDCVHDWSLAGGRQCSKCNWHLKEGPLPERGLGIGLFKLADEEEGGPTRNYVDQDGGRK